MFRFEFIFVRARFLDKAAVEMDGDKSNESSANPWRLCTVTQVEEVIFF